MKNKQDIIGQYQKGMNSTIRIYRDNNLKNAKKLWEYLPELPSGFDVTTSTFGDLWLQYPYNKSIITRIKRIFKSAGWNISHEIKESEVLSDGFFKRNPRISFQSHEHSWDSVEVIVEFSDSMDGATCKRKVIGKETKDIDIVEFVCK